MSTSTLRSRWAPPSLYIVVLLLCSSTSRASVLFTLGASAHSNYHSDSYSEAGQAGSWNFEWTEDYPTDRGISHQEVLNAGLFGDGIVNVRSHSVVEWHTSGFDLHWPQNVLVTNFQIWSTAPSGTVVRIQTHTFGEVERHNTAPTSGYAWELETPSGNYRAEAENGTVGFDDSWVDELTVSDFTEVFNGVTYRRVGTGGGGGHLWQTRSVLSQNSSNSGGDYYMRVDAQTTFSVNVVPEPATLAVLGLGAVFALVRRRRSSQ